MKVTVVPATPEIGHDLAEWAKGGKLDGSGEEMLASARAAAGQGGKALQAYWSKLSAADRKAVSSIQAELTALRDAADAKAAGPDDAVDDGWIGAPAGDGAAAEPAADAPPADPEPDPEPGPAITAGFEPWFAELSARATRAVDLAELDAIWAADVQPHRSSLIPPDRDALDNLYGRHRKRLVG